MMIKGKLTKLLKAGCYLFLSAFATGIFAATTITVSTSMNVTPPALTNFSQNIQLAVSIPPQIAMSKPISLTANITNTGNETWFSGNKIGTNINSTNLVYLYAQWIDNKGHILSNVAFPLGRNLLAKQSMALKFLTTAPNNPGTYVLRLSMIQMGVALFYQAPKGGSPLNIPVKVIVS